MSRRRLAQWIDEHGVQQYGVRGQPFWISSGTYGYYSDDPKDEERNVEQTVTATIGFVSLVLATLAVDVRSGLAIVPIAVILDRFLKGDNWRKFTNNFQRKKLPWGDRIKALFTPSSPWSEHGISGVMGVMAGYLGAQVMFDKDARKLWIAWVGAGGTLASYSLALYTEIKGLEHTNHFAHFGGMTYGFLAGWLIKRFWRKKTRGVGFFRRWDGTLTLALLAVIAFKKFASTAGKKRKAEKILELAERKSGAGFDLAAAREEFKKRHNKDPAWYDSTAAQELS